MTDAILRENQGEIELSCPTVGEFFPAVEVGAFLAEGQLIGHLEVVGRKRPVFTPAVAGAVRVTEVHRGPAEYGQRLLRTTPASDTAFVALAEAAEADLPAGSRAVRAPIDGMFFAAPSPDEGPFVRLGDVVADGQVVGLVEVMKFFYEIRSEGVSGTVVRVDAASGEVVAAGAAVVWVAP